MTSLIYKECEIDPGQLLAYQRAWENLHGRISGRSNEFGTITKPVSLNFSGLIGEELRATAEENQGAWSSSMMACNHAYGVISKVHGDILWYKSRIEEIKEGLNWSMRYSGPSTQDDIDNILNQHNELAAEAWRELERRCEGSEDMLREGPTPENIHALTEAGYLPGSAGYYTTGDLDYYYITNDDAETFLAHVKEGMRNGYEGSLEGLEFSLALLNNVIGRGLTAQDRGEYLSGNEMNFLETIFDSLSENPDPRVGPDFMGFLSGMNGNEHLSESLKSELNRSLSNAILVLSNENLGGGYDKLPEDVREIADGIEFTNVSDAHGIPGMIKEWQSGFIQLTDFLGNSGPGVLGGTEFSVTLMGTTMNHLHYAGEPGYGPITDERFGTALDVASRNRESNYIMLTGEYPDGAAYEHHENHPHVTPERFIERLYTFDWQDDGRQVRGITDWIDEYQASEDPERNRMGSDAFLALVDTITSEEMQEALSQTGHEVEDEDSEVTWRDVSFTQLNPEIADSFADLFLANIEVMESPAGFNITDSGEMIVESIENGYNRHGDLRLDPATRLVFTEYIMGSEEAAIRIHSASSFRTDEGMADYFGSYPPDPSQARESGILRGLIETALNNEHEAAVDRTNGAIDHRNAVMSGSVDLTAAVFNEIDAPGVSSIAEMMKLGFKAVLEEDHINVPRDSSGDYSPMATGNRATLHAAIILEGQGVVTFEGVDQIRDPQTGEISLNPEHWVDATEDGGTEPLDPEEVLGYIDDMGRVMRQVVWPGSATPAESATSVTESFGIEYQNAVTALENIG